MASLPKSDEWSITYSMRKPSQGFHWFENDKVGTWHLTENLGPGSTEVLTGTKIAYDATLELRSLGMQLREIGEDGKFIAPHDPAFRSLVLPMVDKYGPLFESTDPHLAGRNSFHDDSISWMEVALDVTDLWDMRRAMVEGKLNLVADRFHIEEDRATYRRSSEKTWTSPQRDPHGRKWTRRPRWTKNPDRVTNSHVWAVFAEAVNGYLESALSIALDPFSVGDPRIEVRGLAPVVCARLWLQVVHQREDEIGRPQTCRRCGDPIEGTKRREFCSDRCRKAFSRQKAA